MRRGESLVVTVALKCLVKLIPEGDRWRGVRVGGGKRNYRALLEEYHREKERQTGGGGTDTVTRRRENGKKEGSREGRGRAWTAWYICDYTRRGYTMRHGGKRGRGTGGHCPISHLFFRSLGCAQLVFLFWTLVGDSARTVSEIVQL